MHYDGAVLPNCTAVRGASLRRFPTQHNCLGGARMTIPLLRSQRLQYFRPAHYYCQFKRHTTRYLPPFDLLFSTDRGSVLGSSNMFRHQPSIFSGCLHPNAFPNLARHYCTDFQPSTKPSGTGRTSAFGYPSGPSLADDRHYSTIHSPASSKR
jgi:hypothetical protein